MIASLGGNRPNMNYYGADWASLKAWLQAEQLTVYQRLANLRATNDETQQLRGRASFLAQVLGFDEQVAAERAANKE